MPAKAPQPDLVPAATARRLLMHAQGLLDDPSRRATPAARIRHIGLSDALDRFAAYLGAARWTLAR